MKTKYFNEWCATLRVDGAERDELWRRQYMTDEVVEMITEIGLKVTK